MPTRFWPKPFNYFSNVKFFLVSLCVVLSLFVAAAAYFLYSRTDTLLLLRVREQAVAYADLINQSKMWNYDYGGVYVEKKGGTESNTYLRRLGINPDVRVEGGRTFTMRNHAIMIKEISLRSEKQGGVRFRITAPKPIDPDNTPDSVEMEAFRQFAKGKKEVYQLEREADSGPLFRYLLPLYVEQSCLQCHGRQGYKIGSVMGALSITIPVATLIRETDTYKMVIVAATLATIGFLVGITYFLTWRLVLKLDTAQQHLKKLASTDELTGLRNRRRIMKRLDEEYQRAFRLGEPLCLIMLDLDHFKRINDTYGHPFGDRVLKCVAELMEKALRRYDILGRIGGEEFLIVAPGTTQEEAVVLAERLRNVVEKEKMTCGDKDVKITVSCGVAFLGKGDESAETLLKRADAALYIAKQEGRNRVAVM